MKSVVAKYFLGLCTVIFVVGCGGGDNNNVSSTDSDIVDTVQISGAGIKGPLAFADVKIYALDPTLPALYDKTSPISIAITNQFAEINGLSVPRKIKPPYILSIGGSNGIDLNTGVAPVIDTLITIITEDMLTNNRPIFATPLTTVVFHRARLSSTGAQYNSKHAASKAFIENINKAASVASSTFVIGQDHNIDLLRSPLVINEYTVDLAGQEQAVYHRAAVEAFAAKIHELALLGEISADIVIENLALDINSDGVIDNSDNGKLIGGIDPIVLGQESMRLFIPNTPYRIEEIMILMEEERIFIGTNMGPDFLVDEIVFPEVSSTNIRSPHMGPDFLVDEIVFPEVSSTNTRSPQPVATVASESFVTFSVDSIDFRSQYVGEISNPIALVLKNSGAAPLNILDVSITSGFTEVNNCSDYVPAGGNCTFDIQFIPDTTGNIVGKLTIVSDAINSSEFVIFSGVGIGGDQFNTDLQDNVFYNNFINEARHTYSVADLQNYWGVTGTVNLRNAVDVVADPDPDGTHDNALRVFYAGDNYGKRGDSGAQWPVRFSGHDELYLAYDVFFEDDAEFVKGGKLPRLQSTGWKGNPGIPADGTDRWTAGLMWREDGKLVSYVYHADMSGS